MPVVFECPACGRSKSLPDKWAGKRAKCPCGHSVLIGPPRTDDAPPGPDPLSPRVDTLAEPTPALPGDVPYPGPRPGADVFPLREGTLTEPTPALATAVLSDGSVLRMEPLPPRADALAAPPPPEDVPPPRRPAPPADAAPVGPWAEPRDTNVKARRVLWGAVVGWSAVSAVGVVVQVIRDQGADREASLAAVAGFSVVAAYVAARGVDLGFLSDGGRPGRRLRAAFRAAGDLRGAGLDEVVLRLGPPAATTYLPDDRAQHQWVARTFRLVLAFQGGRCEGVVHVTHG